MIDGILQDFEDITVQSVNSRGFFLLTWINLNPSMDK